MDPHVHRGKRPPSSGVERAEPGMRVSGCGAPIGHLRHLGEQPVAGFLEASLDTLHFQAIK